VRVTKKPNPKPDDPEESQRFIDMAREVEVDESEGAFDRAFKKVVPGNRRSGPRQPPQKS
jgi:hypothetical protein